MSLSGKKEKEKKKNSPRREQKPDIGGILGRSTWLVPVLTVRCVTTAWVLLPSAGYSCLSLSFFSRLKGKHHRRVNQQHAHTPLYFWSLSDL